MTLPLPNGRQSFLRTRANWLGRYLNVEQKFDKKAYNALMKAAEDIDKALESLIGKDNESVKVRRVQLNLARKEIRAQIKELFGVIYDDIKTYRAEAAVEATSAGLFDQSKLLTAAFKNKKDRTSYEKSLKQSASRNIDAVMTRVLETEQPLSKRVYRSRALSTGMIDRAINSALAKGDSAANLAKNIVSLIRPDVPGGVSYAAKRLGRTEINNAFHAQSIHDAQNVPWVQQMRWHLSKVHKEQPGDLCEVYFKQGLFVVEHVPEKPHPNCRCFVTPESLAYEVFESNLLAGQYDSYLDQFIDAD